MFSYINKRFLVRVSLFVLLAFNFACSHVGLKYSGDYQSELSGPGRVVVEKSYPVRWLAVLCGGIFWAFGGMCWGYTVYPTDSMTEEVRQKAMTTLAAQVPDYRLTKETLDPNQWKFMYENAMVISGKDYKELKDQEKTQAQVKEDQSKQSQNSLSDKEKKAFDMKVFESSIVSKPSKNEMMYSENDSFPMGWPEKWYFESADYRYWTIVGDLKENQSTAMAASAAKVQELLAREFPQKNYKEVPRFETTHNHVKKIKGKYQSWRIVRVSHDDVSKLAR
ncbi:MAG: hypothetical protein ACXVCP_15615 [Bdellovibrio sp.]